jgi:hypothetical protein
MLAKFGRPRHPRMRMALCAETSSYDTEKLVHFWLYKNRALAQLLVFHEGQLIEKS